MAWDSFTIHREKGTSYDVPSGASSYRIVGDGPAPRGPVDTPQYSDGYDTADFCDPDGYVLEAAVSPNLIFE